MKLTEPQIAEIEKYILDWEIEYREFFDEMLDHFVTDIEGQMNNGSDFYSAFHITAGKFSGKVFSKNMHTKYHGLKAFEMDALDYILKPVDPKRLEETVKKVIQNQESEFQQNSTLKYVRIERFLNIHDSVFIKDNEKCYFVSLQDVRYFESDGNYVKVFFDRNFKIIYM